MLYSWLMLLLTDFLNLHYFNPHGIWINKERMKEKEGLSEQL